MEVGRNVGLFATRRGRANRYTKRGQPASAWPLDGALMANDLGRGVAVWRLEDNSCLPSSGLRHVR